MRQTGLVILTPIMSGHVEVLRQHLRTRIEPRLDSDGELACLPDMRFDRLHMLHFASMAVLEDKEGDDPMDPCLLFEATIDGEPEDFLDELIALCGRGLDLIYGHCEGYPASGVGLPHLVKSYLAGHAIRPQIEFQGHPGRTISEIRGEDALRQHLVSQLENYTNMSAEFSGSRRQILQEVRRNVAADLAYRWSIERRAELFETEFGRWVVVLSAALLALATGAASVFLASPDGTGFFHCMREPLGPETGCPEAFDQGWVGRTISLVGSAPHQWGGSVLAWIAIPGVFFWTAAAVVISWASARGLQFLCEFREKPANAGVTWVLRQGLRRAAMLVRLLSLVALFGLGLANLGAVDPPDWISARGPGALIVLLLVVLLGIPAVLVIRYIRTMPSLDSSFGHASSLKRASLSLASDALWLVMAIVIWLILVALDWATGFLSGPPEPVLASLVTWLVSGSIGLLCVLAVFLVAILAWLLSIWVRELLRDNRTFADTSVLTEHAVDPQRFAREGHGINKAQNHLISLSRIKPGRLRLLRLRLVALTVNLMCRWWFTRGELGDVGDIHFLRWIIVDRGRRLLFLDTYQGSWSGYLDAFIDSGSVHGLNAIWSHTYQRVPGVARPVGFPRTECMLWKGARDERPFKAAVRASQKETIVWYSAYPAISGANIITNSRIRNDLFRPLDTAEIDALIGRIR